MAQSKAARKVLQADRLIDSSGGPVRSDVAVLVEGELIKEILPRNRLDAWDESSYEMVDFPGGNDSARPYRLSYSHQHAG